MGIAISRSLLDELLAQALATPDVEICGLLFGDDERIASHRPATNVSPSAEDSFEVDPRMLFAALRAERAGGPRLIGYYHSHPAGPAEPSRRDAEAAAPDGRLWLILGGREAGLYRAVEQGQRYGRFDTLALDVLTP